MHGGRLLKFAPDERLVAGRGRGRILELNHIFHAKP